MQRKAFSRVLLALLAALLLLTGCGTAGPAGGQDLSADPTTVSQTAEDSAAAVERNSVKADEAAAALDPDGAYTSKEDVSLYLYTYGELPSNFLTKKEARKLGWEGGSLEQYAPGMCIGGDYFGNYEGVLPTDEEYHECDIDTLGKSKRGAKRLVYSDENIYYTEDHYETFELLYGEG